MTSIHFLIHVTKNPAQYSEGWRNVCQELIDARARAGALKEALTALLRWTATGGSCPDCDPFRAAPSCIDFQHHAECGHLEDINKALVLLGREPLQGHTYEDALGEMQRLADERAREVTEGRVTPLAEEIARIEKLAAEVNRDLPGEFLEARMAEAMKRSRGSMAPRWLREALIRVAPAESRGVATTGDQRA